MTINGSKKEMVYYDSLGGEGCDYYYETYWRVIVYKSRFMGPMDA